MTSTNISKRDAATASRRLCRANVPKLAGRKLVQAILKRNTGDEVNAPPLAEEQAQEQDVDMVDAQSTFGISSNEESHSVQDEEEDAGDVEEEINEPTSDTEEDHFHQSEAGINKHTLL